MRSVNSYQDIKTPEEEEKDRDYDSLLQSMLDEYDSDMGSYQAYKLNCIRKIRKMRYEK